MLGFWSFLPLSTSDTIYYNGKDSGFILYIQQEENNIYNICTIINIDMQLQKQNNIIL